MQWGLSQKVNLDIIPANRLNGDIEDISSSTINMKIIRGAQTRWMQVVLLYVHYKYLKDRWLTFMLSSPLSHLRLSSLGVETIILVNLNEVMADEVTLNVHKSDITASNTL